MIEYKYGDMLHEDAQALVNTVNCVGVMGRGIALQFKNTFPGNFKAYEKACKNNEVKPGKMFVFETGHLTHPHYIINFPTKRHWQDKSRIEDIKAGLADLINVIQKNNIHSIAIPPLGCGLGGLNWPTVKSYIEEVLRPISDVKIFIYEPHGAPVKTGLKKNIPEMTPGRAVLIELVRHYLNGLLDPFVTLLEVHKLMYFMQEAGEPLRLKYRKAIYGPYAENLRHVLNAIEGYFIGGYADGSDNPDRQLKLLPGSVNEAVHFLEKHPDTRDRFNRVAELVEGFESPFGLELLSTVHWVMTQDNAQTLDEVIHHTYAWNEQKKQFTPRQISIAVEVLSKNGWVNKFS